MWAQTVLASFAACLRKLRVTRRKSHPRTVRTGQKPRVPRDWLKKQARLDLAERVAIHADNLGQRPKRITVRDQTTRWGSCSSSGVLSFSWRLILAPSFVLDYVAAHEVAHLEEMNHEPQFWALVDMLLENRKPAQKWLRDQGSSLHIYGK